MANYAISSSGVTEVPLGGTAVLNINAKVGGSLEDVDSVRIVLKDPLSATISDETFTGAAISTTATDGGAIGVTDPIGTGTYRYEYTVPNNGTYTPPATGSQFCIEVTIDEGGDLGTNSVTFLAVPTDVTISFDSSTVSAIVKRRTGILETIMIPGENVATDALTLPLRTGIVYAIDAAYKNGTSMALGVDYFWNTFNPVVTLGTAATDADYYVFRAQMRMEETVILDFINESEDFIMGKLSPFYETTDLLTHPTVISLVAARTIGYIKEELQEGVALENAKYRSGRELVDETTMMLKAICAGSVGLLDEDGNPVPRRDGSTVAGFIHPDGAVSSRIQMLDRAQKWTGVFRDLYPETRPSLIVSARSLP